MAVVGPEKAVWDLGEGVHASDPGGHRVVGLSFQVEGDGQMEDHRVPVVGDLASLEEGASFLGGEAFPCAASLEEGEHRVAYGEALSSCPVVGDLNSDPVQMRVGVAADLVDHRENSLL